MQGKQNGRGDPSEPKDPRRYRNTILQSVWDGSFLEAPLELTIINSKKYETQRTSKLVLYLFKEF